MATKAAKSAHFEQHHHRDQVDEGRECLQGVGANLQHQVSFAVQAGENAQRQADDDGGEG